MDPGTYHTDAQKLGLDMRMGNDRMELWNGDELFAFGLTPKAALDVARNLIAQGKVVDTEAPKTYNKPMFTSDKRLKSLLRSHSESLRAIAIENGVWKDRYADLEPGQLRMTIGNLLRRKLEAGAPVKIGKYTL